MTKPLVVVVGEGRLGQSLALYLHSIGLSFQTLKGRDPLIFQKIYNLSKARDTKRPSITHIINTAAITDVAKCQENPALAFKVNSVLPLKIRNSISPNVHLTHISTDQVYSCKGFSKENDASPVNVYGWSKVAADLALAQAENTLVLRTNYIGISLIKERPSLIDWAISQLSRNQTISGYSDILFNPLTQDQLTQLIVYTATHKLTGIFNVGSHDSLSKLELIQHLCRILGYRSDLVVKSKYADCVDKKLPRPLDMRMDVNKIKKSLPEVKLPTRNDLISEIRAFGQFYR